jgi:hypothetical protein
MGDSIEHRDGGPPVAFMNPKASATIRDRFIIVLEEKEAERRAYEEAEEELGGRKEAPKTDE